MPCPALCCSVIGTKCRIHNQHGRTCMSYCSSIGRGCAGAQDWLASSPTTCAVSNVLTCDHIIASDKALCQCGEPLAARCAAGQYENHLGSCIGCPTGKFHPWVIPDCKSHPSHKASSRIPLCLCPVSKSPERYLSSGGTGASLRQRGSGHALMCAYCMARRQPC